MIAYYFVDGFMVKVGQLQEYLMRYGGESLDLVFKAVV